MVLNRLMARIKDKLSHKLNGYLPQRGTQQCVASFLANTRGITYTAFIDLKSAFDIANREVIMYELAKMDIGGKLLGWILGYLSNRRGYVLYQGYTSEIKDF